MTSRLKAIIFVCFGFVFSLWWFGVNNQVTPNLAEQAYTPQDYAQDMCKIYSDLGRGSEQRGDFAAAVTAYQAALKHNPENKEIRHRLNFCQNKLKPI